MKQTGGLSNEVVLGLVLLDILAVGWIAIARPRDGVRGPVLDTLRVERESPIRSVPSELPSGTPAMSRHVMGDGVSASR